MRTLNDVGDRRAPYAPISALERFFERIRDLAVPELVDQRYLRRLGVASNNEYALLSALKFLDIIDDRGRPTHVYHQLQTTDHFQPTLRHLVTTSYAAVFDAGAGQLSHAQLVDWFRTNSSASQAKNAARFFQLVCRLAGIEDEPPVGDETDDDGLPSAEPAGSARLPPGSSITGLQVGNLLAVKAELLSRLPVADPSWSPQQYTRVCELFAQMLASLDTRQ